MLTGLTNGTAYYFKVTATNANGSAPISAAFGPTTPLSQDSTLSNLVLRTKLNNSANAIGATFSTAFASGTRAYSAEVAAGNQFVTVTPTQGIAGQIIKVNGTTVVSGAQSTDIAIAYGANTVTVVVQSPDRVADALSSASSTYTITVTRLNPDMSSFTQFTSSSTAASPVTATFTNIGITGVNNANIVAINSAIASLPATAVDSPAEIQAIVNSYVAVLGQAAFYQRLQLRRELPERRLVLGDLLGDGAAEGAVGGVAPRLLVEQLQDAAAHSPRAWVLADYEAPAGVPLAATIDLGA